MAAFLLRRAKTKAVQRTGLIVGAWTFPAWRFFFLFFLVFVPSATSFPWDRGMLHTPAINAEAKEAEPKKGQGNAAADHQEQLGCPAGSLPSWIIKHLAKSVPGYASASLPFSSPPSDIMPLVTRARNLGELHT